MIIGKNIETLLSALRDAFNRLVNGKQVVGYQSITITSGGPYSLTVPSGATEAIINTDSTTSAGLLAAARWTVDGTIPATGTAGTEAGMPMFDGVAITLKGTDALKAFRVINTSGNVRALKVTYFK